MVYQTARTQDETIKTVGGIQTLHSIKQTGNHVVTARSLTTTKDNTHIHGLVALLFTGNELYERHSVGIGEESLDFFLVVNTLSGSTFYSFYCALQSTGQLGLIGCSCNLQCTFFHTVLEQFI